MAKISKEDEKLLYFLRKQRSSRIYIVISSSFSIFVGTIGILNALLNSSDKYFWGGLYFLSLGLALLFVNSKFIKLFVFVEKLLSAHSGESERRH